MTKRVTILAVFIFLLCTVWSPVIYQVAGQAQDQITVSNSTVQANYPSSLTFSCYAQSDADITDIRLQYQVEQMSFAEVTSEAKISLNPSLLVNASYTLDMEQYGQIPPGIDIDYWWIVKDAAGDELQTAPSHYTVVDSKHTWNKLTQGKINLYWYGQNQSFGQAVMSEAQTALSTLASDTGATPDKMVNISVYTSVDDYAASVLGVEEWSGGVEFPQYNSILLLIRPSLLNSDLSGVAHELTHVIVYQVTSNPYNYIPFWLNEGLAMHIQFPQGDLPSQFSTALSNAITSNNFISVRSLSDPFSAYPDKAYLSYTESASIVTYLIDQYGPAKMEQFLNTFKQGATYDGALQANYGFDMDGLFTQWKAWVNQENGKQPIY
jgi:hypothetical protein